MYELIQSKPWAQELTNRIKNYIKRGDTVNIWGLPTVGTSSFLRKLANTSKEIEYIFFDTQISPITSSKSFYNLLTLQLSQISTSSSPEELKNPTILKTHSILEKILEDKPACIIIDSIESLTSLDEQFLSSLKSLRDKFIGSLGIIFVSNRPLHGHPHFSKYPSFIDFATHEEIISEPFTRKEIDPLLKPLQDHFNVKITTKLLDELTELSGGIFGIFKSTLRYLETAGTNKIDENQMIKEPAIATRLERIFSSFTKEERNFLKLLALGKKTPPIKSRYVLKSGVLYNNSISSNLLNKYIIICRSDDSKNRPKENPKSEYNHNKSGIDIDMESGEIFRNRKRLPDILSDTELRLINHMLANPKSITTRDDIAKIIWEKNHLKEYSDWAIDKSISRIRGKLMDRKRPYKYLVTIKGKGFKLHLP